MDLRINFSSPSNSSNMFKIVRHFGFTCSRIVIPRTIYFVGWWDMSRCSSSWCYRNCWVCGKVFTQKRLVSKNNCLVVVHGSFLLNGITLILFFTSLGRAFHLLMTLWQKKFFLISSHLGSINIIQHYNKVQSIV